MTQPAQTREDPVVTSARREAAVVFATWIAAMTWTVATCYVLGYNRTDLKFVLGFPDWIAYGIVLPWSVCIVFSLWFGATFMHDEQLGDPLPSDDE